MDRIEGHMDCANKFDFTKGFSRFHVVWPLNKISKTMQSPAFKTTMSTGDGTISLTWNLCVSASSGNSEDTWLGLRLQTMDKMVPVVFRIFLSSAVTKKPLMRPLFRVFDGNVGWTMIKSVAEMATLPDGGAVFHCWIDIPNTGVIGWNNRKRKREASGDSSDASTCSEFRRQNIDLFTTDITKQFSGVANGEDGCSDIAFAISKNGQVIRRFPCHRFVLSARSPVFERLFAKKEWKENLENGDRVIEIEDIDETTMEMVLNHIYTAYLPDKSATIDQLLDLIYAADKYNLSSLKNWCVHILIVAYPKASERIQQLEAADRHSLGQLKAICVSQLSMDIAFWKTQADRDRIPSDLLSEILTATDERQYETEEIVLASE